jgi:hypothetical protein
MSKQKQSDIYIYTKYAIICFKKHKIKILTDIIKDIVRETEKRSSDNKSEGYVYGIVSDRITPAKSVEIL